MKARIRPARSDLEHAILGTEVELLADALELCELSLLERRPSCSKIAHE